MKKTISTLLLLASFLSLAAQEPDEKPMLAGNDAKLMLAAQLSRHGYAEKSALSLIEAARIVIDANLVKEPLLKEKSDDGNETSGNLKQGHLSLDVDELLADAAILAGKDKHLQAIIAQVRREAPQRGRVGGTAYDTDDVKGHSSVTYRMNFKQKEPATVIVVGDGDTALNLNVYDVADNLVASDDKGQGDCLCQWIPEKKGQYRIVIGNKGSLYNRFIIRTN